MRYRTSLSLTAVIAALLCTVSCTRSEMARDTETVNFHGREYPSKYFHQDVMHVKLTRAMADSLDLDSLGNVRTAATGVKSVDGVVASLGIVEMERMFPYAGKFEARTRAAGLDLWYNVRMDQDRGLTRAMEELSAVEGFDKVEYSPVAVLVDNGTAVRVSAPSARRTSSATDIFDDTFLPDQWNLYNNGSGNNTIAGADINVIPVWRNFTKGSSDVIVAVVDGGVDYDHVDLAANMWRNPEQSGELVYGWNFVTDAARINPEDHGTHVAGIIAAVNNNGRGVCGIAGGDGGGGARIMSCQIFDGNEQGLGATAIKWAADHGAVIAQNSWGYEYASAAEAQASKIPEYDIEAFDYFTRNAGYDENGRQTGPMAGGLVIFAAGNDGWSVGHPGDYEGCVAVSAISADYRPAYYTNYGDWVDIAAPGGDANKRKQIYSTLNGDEYGYMQGTSMACPHVSGIAALVISRYNGSITTDELRRRLLEGVRNISTYTAGKAMGAGLADTYLAVVGDSGEPPMPVTDLTCEVLSNRIDFSLSIPEDPDDGKPNMIYIYYHTEPFDDSDLDNIPFRPYMIEDLEPRDRLTDSLPDLEFEQTYYLAAVASDYGSKRSRIQSLTTVTTGPNHAPELTALNGTTLSMKAWQTGTLLFRAVEPDEHPITATAGPDTVSLSTAVRGDTVALYIYGPTSAPGNHQAWLKVADPYGLYDEISLSYYVEPNNAPVKIREIDGILFNSFTDPSTSLSLTDYFSDPDGERLTYSIEVSSFEVANVITREDRMVVTPMGYGNMTATITGTDALGETVSSTFPIIVRDGTRPIDVYPSPVTDTLYIRAGSASSCHISITASSGSTVYDVSTDISPFSPHSVDMTSLPGGHYTVSVTIDGTRHTETVVKL